MIAAYNSITAPKELHLQLEMGHRFSTEFTNKTTERILDMMDIQ